MAAARRQIALAALRAVATECLAVAAGFSDEQAATGMTIIDELRALFQRLAAASSAVPESAVELAQPPELLSDVPRELQSFILSQLDTRDLACLAATCRLLWYGAPSPPPPLPPTPGLVETELRRRAEARGLHIVSSLPEGALSWVTYLLKRDLRNALRRESPLAVGDLYGGSPHSLFVDREGRLHLACLRLQIKAGMVGEPLLGHDWGSAAGASTGSVPLTLVPSMQDKRIVSVASGFRHFLALSAEGEVYSWGDGSCGALGHADGSASAGPRRIETLAHIESISAGNEHTSAAVDDRGRLFTWGRGALEGFYLPAGLGYKLDPETMLQLTPKIVDALSHDRVVCVALGWGFTLAVTDAGAVFSFGYSQHGALGHGSLETEILPRRIETLAETGWRFVAVAAGTAHALALTEEGQVYGWGDRKANGYGLDQYTPQLVTAFTLAGQRVALVYAQGTSSCAVTEEGEFYTWGDGYLSRYHLGHEVNALQLTPKRVEALSRIKVAAAAISDSHCLVAGEDSVVWAFGQYAALGLCEADAPPRDSEDEDSEDEDEGWVVEPTPIPNLRVRTLP